MRKADADVLIEKVSALNITPSITRWVLFSKEERDAWTEYENAVKNKVIDLINNSIISDNMEEKS